MVSHALSTINNAAMQYMLTNAEHQQTTAAVQTYNITTGVVCTDSA